MKTAWEVNSRSKKVFLIIGETQTGRRAVICLLSSSLDKVISPLKAVWLNIEHWSGEEGLCSLCTLYNTLLIVQPNISWLKAVFDFSSLMINQHQGMRQEMHPYNRTIKWNCQMWKSFSDEIKTMCLRRLDTLLSRLTSGIVLERVCRSTRGGWSTQTNPLIIFIGTVSD